MTTTRPGTAGMVRSASKPDYSSLRALSGPTEPIIASRPSTATLLGRNSTPLFGDSKIATIGLPQKEAPPIMRRQPSVPKFIEDEKMVCRFYGFFTEDRVWDYDSPLGVPNIEREVVRNVTIYYYLIDQTVQIIEAKIGNTGIFSKLELFPAN